ncbi:MAG: dTMP kinase, partial [Elusimicrobiota bacterium]
LLPALKERVTVICERYTLSTDVYQGLARSLGLKTTGALNAVATGGLKPDLTVVIAIPEAEFRARDKSRVLDRLEREDSAFHRKVRQGYRDLARRAPRTLLLDGTRDAGDLHREILSRVERRLQ